MIAFVQGIIDYIGLDSVIIDVNGVGYNVNVSIQTIQQLPKTGENVKLYTYTLVREDAIALYGFMSRSDLDIFKQCIGVNGIGPKAALSILSVMSADDLRFAIMSQDTKAISKAPGVGTKMAQRLILELKDKIKLEDTLIGGEISGNAVLTSKDNINIFKKEAVDALVSLGYGQAESLEAVNRVATPDNFPDITQDIINSEDNEDKNNISGKILKLALKHLF